MGVPSERLNPRAAQGFTMIGFALPFLLVGLLLQSVVQFGFFIVVPAALGIWMIASSGGFGGHAGIWWKNALRYVGNGAVNGATIAVFLALMVSCMSGLGTAGYVGAARGVGLRG